MNSPIAAGVSGVSAFVAWINIQHASAAAALLASLIAAAAGLPVVVEKYAPQSRLGRWFAARKASVK